MTSSYALQVYRNTATLVDDKKHILLTVYEGLVNLLERARRGIEEKSPKERGEAIGKALAVIGELDCALDREVGGEIAENLENLYRFTSLQLTLANVKNDLDALDAARRVIETLKEAFEQAARNAQSASNAESQAVAVPGKYPGAPSQEREEASARKGVCCAV